jgi:hypothetical protein
MSGFGFSSEPYSGPLAHGAMAPSYQHERGGLVGPSLIALQQNTHQMTLEEIDARKRYLLEEVAKVREEKKVLNFS